MEAITLTLDQVIEHHANVRSQYDDESIVELADSIAENGLLQPLLVHGGQDGTFQLIAGHRRIRAIQHLVDTKRWKKNTPINAVVTSSATTDGDATVLMLVENCQRADISAFDEARGYRRLMQEFGVKQTDVAKRVGKSQSHIAKRLALLSLPDEIHALVPHRIGLDDAYTLSTVDEEKLADIVKSLTGNKAESYLQHTFEYELRRAVTYTKDKADSVKFLKALDKAMIEYSFEYPWGDNWRDRQRYERINRYTAENLNDYVARKNHTIVAGPNKKVPTFIEVYRKLTPKQLEQQEQQRAEQIEQADAKYLESLTIHERWELEVEKLTADHQDRLDEYTDQLRHTFGAILVDGNGREVGKVAMGVLALRGTNPSQAGARKACDVLGVVVPDVNEDGVEFSPYDRPYTASLLDWIGSDTTRAVMAAVATLVDDRDLVEHDHFATVRDQAADHGLSMPILELPPEPWLDESTGEWRTDVPPPPDVDDVSVPMREEFESDEEYEAAVQNWEAYQASA